MKTKQNKTLAVVIIFAAIMTLSSCQKEKLTTTVKGFIWHIIFCIKPKSYK